MKGEILRLEIVERQLVGEVALEMPPGTTAAVRDRALERLLSSPMIDLAAAHDLVLAASNSAFAVPAPGKDEQGRTRFTIRGRIEGDRVIPQRRGA